MAEQKMTYQEMVDKAAETYAVSYNSYMDFPTEEKSRKDFQYEGKKAVAAQAEAIRDYVRIGFHFNRRPANGDVEHYLLEHGYIEPKTEEDGSVEKI